VAFLFVAILRQQQLNEKKTTSRAFLAEVNQSCGSISSFRDPSLQPVVGRAHSAQVFMACDGGALAYSAPDKPEHHTLLRNLRHGFPVQRRIPSREESLSPGGRYLAGAVCPVSRTGKPLVAVASRRPDGPRNEGQKTAPTRSVEWFSILSLPW